MFFLILHFRSLLDSTDSAHSSSDPADSAIKWTAYVCTHYSRAYLHHLFKAKEMLASTLATIHNEWFTVSLVDAIRTSIEAGQFDEFQGEFLGRYGSGRQG